ncbi:MAG: DUF1015 domain-containing protein [Candidatus Omnitrophota bacterium]|nr:MAG: DUF1015 domain-containing protein [Candidatus Omnitrophota bacterium]
MASTIKPFKATCYNPVLIKDLSCVVCPPYDVISRRELNVLKRKSPYNFCRVLFASKNNYQEVGTRFRGWVRKRVLTTNTSPSLYLYEQRFCCEGKRYSRLGVLALLRMNKKGVIFPHEHTLKAPKQDRRKIIEEVEANLSPIFVVVPQSLNILAQIRRAYSQTKPLMKYKDLEGHDNSIWQIEDEGDIKAICRQIDQNKLVIADGHHRFEVAYEYYRKHKNKFKDLNYILAYITGTQDGLLILPTHRIIKAKTADFLERLRKYFFVSEMTQGLLEKQLRSTGRGKGFSFGVYMKNKFYFLRLKKTSILDTINKGSAYKHLDTYIFHTVVLPLMKSEGQISYTHSVREAKRMTGTDKVAVILRSTPIEIVFKIANKGLRLPQKSTYFYPKVTSGMVIRKFEN